MKVTFEGITILKIVQLKVNAKVKESLGKLIKVLNVSCMSKQKVKTSWESHFQHPIKFKQLFSVFKTVT